MQNETKKTLYAFNVGWGRKGGVGNYATRQRAWGDQYATIPKCDQVGVKHKETIPTSP